MLVYPREKLCGYLLLGFLGRLGSFQWSNFCVISRSVQSLRVSFTVVANIEEFNGTFMPLTGI